MKRSRTGLWIIAVLVIAMMAMIMTACDAYGGESAETPKETTAGEEAHVGPPAPTGPSQTELQTTGCDGRG